MHLASMIYYLNYSNENNPLYNVYLVNDDGVTYPMNVVHIENKYDYKTNYNSSYNLDNISVNASIDLNTITEPGTYRIIIEINNNEYGNVYKDYVELKNPYGRTLPSIEGYALDTVMAKDRIVLRVN